ncbi:hypothetical protein [Faecalicoccus acidiformans]|uniref:Uncharacterized protein n=1 Tax=Faecalicoccus acidiformans TaxID=915173 RepID=A0ABS2FLR4_9FIRM|nr:hypothetical protein [Faecalicoccus acidiformans]MBM6830963.1 hypothetical protein [Faecalicoccus acidiformans]
MNLTQEKLTLMFQLENQSCVGLVNDLKKMDTIDEKNLMHIFIQDTIKFFSTKEEQFYQQIFKTYDSNDLLFYVETEDGWDE